MAIPKFARMYGISCQTCHVAPPKLNSFGHDFVANRYQVKDPQMMRTETVPIAIWTSMLGQQQAGKDFLRGFPNRIEFIAADAVTSSISYFLEWRVLSIELRSDGTFRDRSGRFEDLFLITELYEHLSTTVGQYRMLSQVDGSQRLSISEPLPFSTTLPGRRASTGRLTSLRSFSPFGRSPAVRLQYQADGWFLIATVPLSGEFSIPLTNEARKEASFELEAISKGFFFETYVRKGLNSLGAHLFTGSNKRLLAQIVGTLHFRTLYFTSAAGIGKDSEKKISNMMLEGEYQPLDFGMLGMRFEHQTGTSRNPAYIPYVVIHFPGTSYTIRLAVERRIERRNNQTFIETSVIF